MAMERINAAISFFGVERRRKEGGEEREEKKLKKNGYYT